MFDLNSLAFSLTAYNLNNLIGYNPFYVACL
jgi:hypothetical protein